MSLTSDIILIRLDATFHANGLHVYKQIFQTGPLQCHLPVTKVRLYQDFLGTHINTFLFIVKTSPLKCEKVDTQNVGGKLMQKLYLFRVLHLQIFPLITYLSSL